MTDDPDITLYTMVGKTAMFNQHGSSMISNPYHGFLYVKDGQLCHENTFASRLCKCTKKSWPLSEIKEITVMNGERVRVSDGSNSAQFIFLNPGVKIIFQGPDGNCKTLVSSLPYAAENYAEKLSTKLHQCVAAASKEHR